MPNDNDKSFIPWRRSSNSPSSGQPAAVTALSSSADYLLPPSVDSNLLTRFHNPESMYTYPRSSYDWPYSTGFKTTSETPSWWDMHTSAGTSAWFPETNQSPAMSYSQQSANTDNNYSHLASSLVSAGSTLFQSGYISEFSKTTQSTAVTLPQTVSSTSRTISNPTSKSRRSTGRSTCNCPNCQELSVMEPSVAQHLKLKGQHSCHIRGCGKVYNKTSHLKAHLRWHTGDRPFVCNWLFCGKRFTRSDDLQHHLKTHTEEKKYACSKCNKRYIRSEYLTKHLKTHENKPGQSISPTPPGTPDDMKLIADNNNVEPFITPKQEATSQ